MGYRVDRVIRVTQPLAEPVSLEEAKAHLRVDTSDEDDYITSLISVAREYIDNYTDRFWSECTISIIFEGYPEGYVLDLHFPDITAVSEVATTDETYTETVISSGLYTLDTNRRALIYDGYWPTDITSIRVDATVGIDNTSSPAGETPKPIKQSILLVIADLFNNRTSVSTMQTYKNKAVEMMAFPYRSKISV